MLSIDVAVMQLMKNELLRMKCDVYTRKIVVIVVVMNK